MGYYIDGPVTGKAEHIMKEHGAVRVSREEASAMVYTHGVICIKGNGAFESAGFCYDSDEFDAFSLPHDRRPTEWLVMDRDKASELSGFNRRNRP